MKRKELKNLANKIAKLERQRVEGADNTELERQITELCGHVHSLEDMMQLDEMIQDAIN